MNKDLHLGINIFGRASIIILALTGINRTAWYQSFPSYIPLTDFYGWLIAIGLIGSIVWMILPLFAKGGNGE